MNNPLSQSNTKSSIDFLHKPLSYIQPQGAQFTNIARRREALKILNKPVSQRLCLEYDVKMQAHIYDSEYHSERAKQIEHDYKYYVGNKNLQGSPQIKSSQPSVCRTCSRELIIFKKPQQQERLQEISPKKQKVKSLMKEGRSRSNLNIGHSLTENKQKQMVQLEHTFSALDNNTSKAQNESGLFVKLTKDLITDSTQNINNKEKKDIQRHQSLGNSEDNTVLSNQFQQSYQSPFMKRVFDHSQQNKFNEVNSNSTKRQSTNILTSNSTLTSRIQTNNNISNINTSRQLHNMSEGMSSLMTKKVSNKNDDFMKLTQKQKKAYYDSNIFKKPHIQQVASSQNRDSKLETAQTFDSLPKKQIKSWSQLVSKNIPPPINVNPPPSLSTPLKPLFQVENYTILYPQLPKLQQPPQQIPAFLSQQEQLLSQQMGGSIQQQWMQQDQPLLQQQIQQDLHQVEEEKLSTNKTSQKTQDDENEGRRRNMSIKIIKEMSEHEDEKELLSCMQIDSTSYKLLKNLKCNSNSNNSRQKNANKHEINRMSPKKNISSVNSKQLDAETSPTIPKRDNSINNHNLIISPSEGSIRRLEWKSPLQRKSTFKENILQQQQQQSQQQESNINNSNNNSSNNNNNSEMKEQVESQQQQIQKVSNNDTSTTKKKVTNQANPHELRLNISGDKEFLLVGDQKLLISPVSAQNNSKMSNKTYYLSQDGQKSNN